LHGSTIFSSLEAIERWAISIPSGGIQEHKKSLASRNKIDKIVDEARLFWGALSKQNTEAQLVSLSCKLVPGVDRVVRHICIQCMNQRVHIVDNLEVEVRQIKKVIMKVSPTG